MARGSCQAFLKWTFTVLSLISVAFVPGIANHDASRVFHYGSDGDTESPIYPFTGQNEALLRLRRQADGSDSATNITTMIPAVSISTTNASGVNSSVPPPSSITVSPTPSPSTTPVTVASTNTTVAITTSTQMPSTIPNTGPTDPPIIKHDRKYYVVKMQHQNSDRYWADLTVRGAVHRTLSQGHRLAQTIKLKFTFNFYGHYVTNVTIATGGFLYMSPFLHKFLTATQYIAPLMANFDTSLGNESNIRYLSTSEKLIVQWENVHLQDQVEYGRFNFQVHLKRGGQILFVYKDVPTNVANIKKENHPVKIGLSDAFYMDKDDKALGMKRRTIYEYHRVTVNLTQVLNNTVVVMDPKRTCNMETTCDGCLALDKDMGCSWCGIVQRCSDGTDWYLQNWLDHGCKYLAGRDNCSLIPTVQPQNQPNKPMKQKGKGINPGAVVAIIVLVALVIGIAGWIFYAYRNPTTSSGIWLMEHRPSAMKTKLAKMKFWKQSTPSGDKYAVESQA